MYMYSIHCAVSLQFIGDPSGPAFDLVTAAPVVLGTVPLRSVQHSFARGVIPSAPPEGQDPFQLSAASLYGDAGQASQDAREFFTENLTISDVIRSSYSLKHVLVFLLVAAQPVFANSYFGANPGEAAFDDQADPNKQTQTVGDTQFQPQYTYYRWT